MNEYISREMAVKKLQMQLLNLEADQDKGEYSELCENRGARDALDEAIYDIRTIKAADVQPVKTSKWCPPLMGQGKCDTYCERCYGKIMRNSTGIFEETPFCPHCGARMDGDTD